MQRCYKHSLDVHTYIILYSGSYFSARHLQQLKNQSCHITVNKSPKLLQTSCFFLISFFCSRVSSIIMSPRIPSGCDSFSDGPCFRWPQQVWVVTIRQPVECPVRICLMFPSWLGWATGYQESSGVKCLSQRILPSVHALVWRVTVALTFTTWLREHVFPPVRSPLPYCALWKEVTLLLYFHTEGRWSSAPVSESRSVTEIICSDPVLVVYFPPLFIYWIH